MREQLKNSVLVIVPAFNESKVIEKNLINLKNQLKKNLNVKFDILVVDDGSSDSTYLISRKITKTIRHLVNMGSGAATRTGLEYAKKYKYKYAATIDADGQHNPKDLVRVINKLIRSNKDLVVGSRVMNISDMPRRRIFGNYLLSKITQLILGVKVSDSQSGLKAFSRKAIDNISINSNGFEFCSEILWKAKKCMCDIVEIPIDAIYTEYSLSKGQSSVNALRIIKSIITQKIKEV